MEFICLHHQPLSTVRVLRVRWLASDLDPGHLRIHDVASSIKPCTYTTWTALEGQHQSFNWPCWKASIYIYTHHHTLFSPRSEVRKLLLTSLIWPVSAGNASSNWWTVPRNADVTTLLVALKVNWTATLLFSFSFFNILKPMTRQKWHGARSGFNFR